MDESVSDPNVMSPEKNIVDDGDDVEADDNEMANFVKENKATGASTPGLKVIND